MKVSATTLALLAAGVLSLPAFGQTKADFDEMRVEIQRLRQELNALKGQPPAAATAGASASSNATNDRIEQLEIKQKDAVVLGDIGNSFRLPGSDTSLRIYGFAELNAVKEFKGDNSGNDYSTAAQYAPINGSIGNGKRTGVSYLTARTSRFGLEASTPTAYGPLGIKIEGDFNNEPRTGNSAVSGSAGNIYTQGWSNSYGFRLRQGYGQFGGLLVGQTWSTFMDVDNSPETVDFNGPPGSTFIRQPQIRYAYGTKDMGTFTVALENSVSYLLDPTTPTGVATSGFSKAPDLIGRWDKSFGWGSMSVRGVSQEFRVNDGAGLELSKRGYGLGTTAFVKMRDAKDFLSLALTYGEGIGRYFNGIEGAAFDGSNILLEKALGIVVGYQYKASNTLRANFVLGAQRNYDNDYTAFIRASGFDSGQYAINRSVYQAHLGFIYNPIKNVDFGAEYILGRRETLAGEKGDLSRLNLSAKYFFN